MNAVEREPVETRVLNPNASEASYKPKQRSYRKRKLKKNYIFIFFRGDFVGGILSWNLAQDLVVRQVELVAHAKPNIENTQNYYIENASITQYL